LQARLEEEARQRQDLVAQLESEQVAREAQAQRMAEMMRFMQTLGQHMRLAVPPGLLAPPSTPPAAVATPVTFRLCFACMT
jgi:hypothetical protein